MENSQEFLKDKIFEIEFKRKASEGAPDFNFVHLKVKKIKESTDRILIQIIDMSNKMLYNEVKAE